MMNAPTLTIEEMADSLERLFDEIRATRAAGQAEYARASENVFANFDRIAGIMGLSREEVMMVYAFKHMDGIMAHVSGHRSQREEVRGRVVDLMLYMGLFVASEEAREKARAREGVLVDSYKAGSEARSEAISDEGSDEGSVSDEEWLEGFREHARKAFERGSKRFLTYDFGSAETSGTEIDGYVTYCWLCQCAHEDPCSEGDELHARGWTPAPSGDARDARI